MPSSSVVRKRVSPPSAPEELRVGIHGVGRLGDGIGTDQSGRGVCVPFTLPGEQVMALSAGRRGDLLLGRAQSRIISSPERVAPFCRHFGACGGCAMQHWAPASYLTWKTGLLRDALQAAGYDDPPLLPIVSAGPGERRRIDLAFKRVGRSARMGLHRAADREIVDMVDCAVLHPRLQALLEPLRALLADVAEAGSSGAVLVNLLAAGPDVAIRASALPDALARTRIAEFARVNGVARVHWARGNDSLEAVCILERATARFGGVDVSMPPEAFLQATLSGEAAIIAAVQAGIPRDLPRSTNILELYAGCGTLTFALARHAPITAFEGNAAAFGALRAAANRAFPGRIACHRRDLARQPLVPGECARHSIIVLDPPWIGAAAQVAQIARSGIRRVIYVSCNPAALRRDAEILRSAGFGLAAVTPIDQFLWSAQLESVTVFVR